MNPHKHNPEIERLLNGCKNCYYPSELNKLESAFLCQSCKSIIKGIILAQENEIDFLIKEHGDYSNIPHSQEFYVWCKRLEQLRLSNENLKEKLK